jgi:hypothetical protein
MVQITVCIGPNFKGLRVDSCKRKIDMGIDAQRYLLRPIGITGSTTCPGFVIANNAIKSCCLLVAGIMLDRFAAAL